MAVEPATETQTGWWDDGSELAAGGLTSGLPLKEPQVFKYERPDREGSKFSTWLAKSDIVVGTVQVIREGGEHRLHSHTDIDSFWFVLSGRVQFYGEGNVLTADLGKYEGLVTPRGWKYWFKASSEEPLELLHVTAVDRLVTPVGTKGGRPQ